MKNQVSIYLRHQFRGPATWRVYHVLAYREIEAGSTAARTTTLINISRALGLELMLVAQATVPAVDALLLSDCAEEPSCFRGQRRR
jgi:hypothetical protein